MDRGYSKERFERLPVVGILRGLDTRRLESVVEAARRGGLTNIEITMNTSGAPDQIRAAASLAGDSMNIGAGTVTSLERLDQALEAGAMFVVTPTLYRPVIERCIALDVPVFPGAFTPTEIHQAWEWGATMVKVFPADALGCHYVRNLKSCFPGIRLMPTGGIDQTTIGDYYEAGADGFGVGSPLFQPARIASEDWEGLADRCRLFAEAYCSARSRAVDRTR